MAIFHGGTGMFVRHKAFHMLVGITLGFAALICGCAANVQAQTNSSEHSGVIYRNPRVYNVEYFFELRPNPKKSDRTKDLKLWIPIPREWESQKAVKIISVQPEPHAKYADPEFDNLMLFWDFGKEPEQPSYRVDVKYRLESYEIHAEIDPTKIGPYDKTSDDYALYTRSTHTVSITPKIRELAQAAVGDEENPYLQAKRIFDFVQKKMRYRGGKGSGIQTLLDTLVKDEKTGEACYEGECGQYSAFFVALCRSVGIPARSVSAFVGWRTWPWIEEEDARPWGHGDRTFKALGRHNWAEILLPNYGWMPVDPTYNSLDHIDNKCIITSKNRDIKIGPYPPQSHEEGYDTGPDDFNNGRAGMLWYGVWNLAKSSSIDMGIIHHSDPFPADALAEYVTMLYAEVEAEKNLGLYRKRTLRWIDQNTQEHTDKTAALAQAYEKKRGVRYQHEAFICHMLRKLVGDKKFWQIFETYTDLRVKSGEPVSTARFQKIAEDNYGQPLDWFFKQWVGYTELPQLKLDAVTFSEEKEGWHVRGNLRQLNNSLFHLPVELAIETETTTEHKILWLEDRNTDFEFRTANRPKSVLVDPNNDILRIMEMPPLLEGSSHDEVASFVITSRPRADKARWKPLHFTAETGQADIAAFLISKGDEVNAKNLRGFTPLHFAAMMGHKKVMELLIAKGADVNAKDNEGRIPLSWAAQEGQKEVVRLLIAKGADISLNLAARLGDVATVKSLIEDGAEVNAEERGSETPLHAAVTEGHKEIAELLIAKGADINAKNDSSRTPLHYAAKSGQKDVVELLIAKGADPNVKNKWDRTPLDNAVAEGHKEVVKLLIENGADASLHVVARLGDLARVKSLIENGADVNAKDKKRQIPLHAAVAEGHKEIAELLIAKGADVNVKRGKYPPLSSAVWDEDRDMIKLLVTNGADVNFVAKDDWPFLHYMAEINDRELVELLLAHGAKLNVKDDSGRTELHIAVSRGHRDLAEFLVSKGAEAPEFHLAACLGNLDRVKSFVKKGMDVNTKDELGWTPMYWVASTAQEEVAEFLISKGADVDVRTNDNRTSLHQAARSGAAKLVELLISKGVDSNARAKNNSTPLHSAAEGGHKHIVELLIAAGAEVKAKEKSGNTPLHEAAAAGHADIVEILLANGADVNVKGRRGRTALNMASNNGHTEIVELLRKHGAKE